MEKRRLPSVLHSVDLFYFAKIWFYCAQILFVWGITLAQNEELIDSANPSNPTCQWEKYGRLTESYYFTNYCCSGAMKRFFLSNER